MKHTTHFLSDKKHRLATGRSVAFTLALVLCLNVFAPIALAQGAPPDKPSGGGPGGGPGGGGAALTPKVMITTAP